MPSKDAFTHGKDEALARVLGGALSHGQCDASPEFTDRVMRELLHRAQAGAPVATERLLRLMVTWLAAASSVAVAGMWLYAARLFSMLKFRFADMFTWQNAVGFGLF